MMEIKIKEIEPRAGVFDVRIVNEHGEEEVFTFKNEKKKDGKYKEEIKNAVRNRNSEKKDRSEFESDVGENLQI